MLVHVPNWVILSYLSTSARDTKRRVAMLRSIGVDTFIDLMFLSVGAPMFRPTWPHGDAVYCWSAPLLQPVEIDLSYTDVAVVSASLCPE